MAAGAEAVAAVTWIVSVSVRFGAPLSVAVNVMENVWPASDEVGVKLKDPVATTLPAV